MNHADFKRVLESRITKIREVLDKKAGEYAREGDRLSNFKRAAAFLQCSPEYANLGANSKHLTSIADMVDDIEKGKMWPVAVWEEKLGDAINYLILMEAQVKERIQTTRSMAGGGCPDEGEPVRSGGMEGL